MKFKELAFGMGMAFFMMGYAFAGNIIIANKVAKVGDEIILKNDVEKVARINKLDYGKAKELLIENALLNIGAKMTVDEPSEDDVQKYIKNEKFYYASLVGKSAGEISDEEFLANLHFNNITMLTYKNEVKKKVWREKYLDQAYQKEIIKSYIPTREEIKNLLKTRPELFEEKEGIKLSMIYFSYYNENGEFKKTDQIKELLKKAEKCLKDLKENKSFEDATAEYSDDLISVQQNPKGYAGVVFLDDPRTLTSFNADIISSFKKANIGLLDKIFETRNGLYIFKISDKIIPQKVTGEALEIKAKDYLQKENDYIQKGKVYQKLVDDLKTKISINIF